ncbi:hypothetical protein COHA_009807 [Chlorella ohadii]|nr:hypothetical protein COHA_009807 [Chlorella ohadii]
MVAHSPELASTTCTAGALMPLVTCLSASGGAADSAATRRFAASALSDIARHSADLAASVVAAGAVGAAAAQLRAPLANDARLKRLLLGMLMYVARADAALAEKVVAAGLIHDISRCLKFSDDAVRQGAARCLRDVARQSPSLAATVVHAPGLLDSLASFAASSPSVQALPALLAFGFAAEHSAELAAHVAAAPGVMPALVAALHDLQAKCLKAASTIIPQLADLGALAALVQDAALLPALQELALARCAAIMAKAPASRALFVTSGALGYLESQAEALPPGCPAAEQIAACLRLFPQASQAPAVVEAAAPATGALSEATVLVQIQEAAADEASAAAELACAAGHPACAGADAGAEAAPVADEVCAGGQEAPAGGAPAFASPQLQEEAAVQDPVADSTVEASESCEQPAGQQRAPSEECLASAAAVVAVEDVQPMQEAADATLPMADAQPAAEPAAEIPASPAQAAAEEAGAAAELEGQAAIEGMKEPEVVTAAEAVGVDQQDLAAADGPRAASDADTVQPVGKEAPAADQQAEAAAAPAVPEPAAGEVSPVSEPAAAAGMQGEADAEAEEETDAGEHVVAAEVAEEQAAVGGRVAEDVGSAEQAADGQAPAAPGAEQQKVAEALAADQQEANAKATPTEEPAPEQEAPEAPAAEQQEAAEVVAGQEAEAEALPAAEQEEPAEAALAQQAGPEEASAAGPPDAEAPAMS